MEFITTIITTEGLIAMELKDGVTKLLMGKKLLGLMLEDKKYIGKEENTELCGEEPKLQELIYAELKLHAHIMDGSGSL